MDIHVMIFKNTQNGQKVFAAIQRGVGGNSSQSKPKAYVCFMLACHGENAKNKKMSPINGFKTKMI
jgi:hypothetical protein